MIKTWKGHKIEWCGMCNVATISCSACNNSSCNGGGCDQCNELFTEFNKTERKKYTKRDFTKKEIELGNAEEKLLREIFGN